MEVQCHLVIIITGILVAPVGMHVLPLLTLSLTGWPIHLCHCHLHQLAVIIGIVLQWHWPLMSPPPPHPCCHPSCHHGTGHLHHVVIIIMAPSLSPLLSLSLPSCLITIVLPWHWPPCALWSTCDGGPQLSSTLVVVAVNMWAVKIS